MDRPAPSATGSLAPAGREIRAWVEIQGSADPQAWAERHAAGLVPDHAPYGLDRLAHYGVEPTFRVPRHGFLHSSLARASRRIAGFSWFEVAGHRPARTADVAICWDERYGVPRIIRDGSKLPVATGVIWATESDASPRLASLAAKTLRRAALVWVLSPPQIAILRDGWGLPSSRLAYLPFGVDADFFTPAADVECDPDLVVSVGNDRHRDHTLLIKAIQLVRRSRPTTRLELVTRHPVDPAPGVVIHAHLSHTDLRSLYRRAALIAVVTRPNTHVSGATVFLEAMACARPLVTTDNPGVDSYVSTDRGVLVPPGDVDVLATGLLGLLSDPAHGAQLARSGREAIDRHFSTERQARSLALLLKSRI